MIMGHHFDDNCIGKFSKGWVALGRLKLCSGRWHHLLWGKISSLLRCHGSWSLSMLTWLAKSGDSYSYSYSCTLNKFLVFLVFLTHMHLVLQAADWSKSSSGCSASAGQTSIARNAIKGFWECTRDCWLCKTSRPSGRLGNWLPLR